MHPVFPRLARAALALGAFFVVSAASAQDSSSSKPLLTISGNISVIYPVESPGGWHLIGATPIRLFDLRLDRPSLLSPGDRVRFHPITVSEFDEIQAAVQCDEYHATCETIAL